MNLKKHIATVALTLNLGVTGIYAQQTPVNMSFSGTAEPSVINLGSGSKIPSRCHQT